jgi:hypothetical protein
VTDRGFKWLCFGLLVASCAAGILIGRWTTPVKVETKLETKYVDRVVMQQVKHADEVRTITERRRPDGTVTTRTRIEDRSVTETAAARETVATLEQTVTESAHETWLLRAVYAVRMGSQTFGAGVDRRILGPIWLGAWGTTDLAVGVSLGVSF